MSGISEEDRQVNTMLVAPLPPDDLACDQLECSRSARLKNPIPESEAGPHLTQDDRRALTADAHLLEEMYKRWGCIPGFLAAGPRGYLHFNPANVRVAVVTSGGVCPGLNTVVDAIVRRHYFYAERVKGPGASKPAILGFTNGFRCLVDSSYFALEPSLTEGWPRRGGSVLRQIREAIPTYPDAAVIVETLKRFKIDILYVAGGDGSLQKADEVAGEVKSQGLNIAVAHIPKTMDNDIPWVTESFGFQTAVAEAARLVSAIRDEAESNNRIAIVEIFGAGVGHTAAHTALGSGEVDAVLIPELGMVSIPRIVDHLERRALGPGRRGYAVVLAAEKVTPALNLGLPGQSPLVIALEHRFPMPGVASRVFVNQPRHFIRAVPPNCRDQLYCRQLADCVVDCTLAGYTGFSISRWLDAYVMVPFARTVRRKKHLPLDGIVWKQVMNLTGQPDFST